MLQLKTPLNMALIFMVIAWSSLRCGGPLTTSTPSYAIADRDRGASFYRERSILATIDKNRGSIHVEIDYKVEPEPSEEDQQGFRALIVAEVNHWNDAMKSKTGGAKWPWQEVAVNFVSSNIDSDCRQSDAFWSCNRSDNLRIIVDQNTTRSYAGIGPRMMVIAYNQFAGYAVVSEISESTGEATFTFKPSGLHKNLSLIFKHEYGHIIGLADSYSEENYQTPENSPPAVMNDVWTTPEFTDDDLIGMWHLWDFMKGQGQEYCADSYVKDKAKVNVYNNVFCVPNIPISKSCQDYNGGFGEVFGCFSNYHQCRKINDNWQQNESQEFWCVMPLLKQ